MNDNHVITQTTDHLGNASFSNPRLCGEKWDLAAQLLQVIGCSEKGGGTRRAGYQGTRTSAQCWCD